jgi:DNA-binding transcriptional ArsR family regulator
MLRSGELCACQVTAALALAPSTVSAHLAELRRAGLITDRKDARWVHYRLSDEAGPRETLALLWPGLSRDPVVRSDASVVRRLRAVDVNELCRVDLDLPRLGIKRPSPVHAGARK